MKPELDFSNPLLEGLVPNIRLSEMPAALHREPLAELNWKSLVPEAREQFLGHQKQHFFPTSASVEIAASIQNAIRTSLNQRNPLSRLEQKRVNQLSLLRPDSGMQVLPSLATPATGGMIAAETGMGKTTIIQRALEIIAPEQIICHARSDLCGWSTLTQVLYLRLDFPSNGTRGGLVERILGGMDALIGSDYSERNRRLKNLDASLQFVMKVLSMHRVGMLVIDDLQPDNFGTCPWRREFVLFFLYLLNFGIPLVLCGHPEAFQSLAQEAQVMRRFSAIGHFRLDRAKNPDEPWWKDAFAPGIMRFNVCDEVSDPNVILQASQRASAGIPGIFAECWIEAQRIALRRGGAAATVSMEDFERAKYSPRAIELTRMVEWLDGRSSNSVGYADLSRDAPSRAASAESHSAHNTRAHRTSSATTPAVHPVLKKIRQAESRDLARSERRNRKNEQLLATLEPDDLRVANRALQIFAGLDEHQSELFAAGDSAQAKKA